MLYNIAAFSERYTARAYIQLPYQFSFWVETSLDYPDCRDRRGLLFAKKSCVFLGFRKIKEGVFCPVQGLRSNLAFEGSETVNFIVHFLPLLSEWHPTCLPIPPFAYVLQQVDCMFHTKYTQGQ